MHDTEIKELLVIRGSMIRKGFLYILAPYLVLSSAACLIIAVMGTEQVVPTLAVAGLGFIGFFGPLVLYCVALRGDTKRLEQIVAALPEQDRDPVLRQARLPGLPQRVGPLIVWWPPRSGFHWNLIRALCHVGAVAYLVLGVAGGLSFVGGTGNPWWLGMAPFSLLAVAFFELALLAFARRSVGVLCAAIACALAFLVASSVVMHLF